MMDYLAKLDASIEAMMTPAEALARRKAIEADERKSREAQAIVVHHCAEAIEDLAGAIRWPLICRSEIESAIARLQAALVAAKDLDK